MTSSECNFSNCIFDQNRGISDNSVTTGPFRGCAIFANSSSILNVKLCNFTNNFFYEIGYQSVNTGLNGVCAYLYSVTSATFSDCIFKNSTSYIKDKGSSTYFVATGGAFYLSSSFSSFNRCVFIDNCLKVDGVSKSVHSVMRGSAIYSNYDELICTECSFINNTAYYYSLSNYIEGGAIYMTNGTIKNCCFSDNIAVNGGHICYIQSSVSSYLIIDKCNFITTNDNNGYMKSLIFIKTSENTNSSKMFTNNQLSFSNVENLMIFNGTVTHKKYFNYTTGSEYYIFTYLCFTFENNCVSSYDNIIFKNDDFPLLNENGSKNVTFESSFDSICVKNINNCPNFYQYRPTDVFTNDEITHYSIYSMISDTNFVENPINKDKNGNKSKSKHIEKTILLCSIICLEVVLIVLIIVLIIIVAKNVRNKRDIEPLMDD